MKKINKRIIFAISILVLTGAAFAIGYGAVIAINNTHYIDNHSSTKNDLNNQNKNNVIPFSEQIPQKMWNTQDISGIKHFNLQFLKKPKIQVFNTIKTKQKYLSFSEIQQQTNLINNKAANYLNNIFAWSQNFVSGGSINSYKQSQANVLVFQNDNKSNYLAASSIQTIWTRNYSKFYKTYYYTAMNKIMYLDYMTKLTDKKAIPINLINYIPSASANLLLSQTQKFSINLCFGQNYYFNTKSKPNLTTLRTLFNNNTHYYWSYLTNIQQAWYTKLNWYSCSTQLVDMIKNNTIIGSEQSLFNTSNQGSIVLFIQSIKYDYFVFLTFDNQLINDK